MSRKPVFAAWIGNAELLEAVAWKRDDSARPDPLLRIPDACFPPGDI